MALSTRLLFFFIDLIIPLLIGYWLKKNTRFRVELFDRMMNFGIFVIEPFLGLLSFWVIRFTPQLLLLPVIGIITSVLPGGLAYFLAGRKYSDPLKQGSYILAIMLSNRGVVGMLTVFVLFGEPGYALVQLTLLFSSLFNYMICFPLAEHYYLAGNQTSLAKPRFSLLRLLNWKQFPLLGMLLGVALNSAGIGRPALGDQIFPYLVHFNAMLFVIPVGYTMEIEKFGHYWRELKDIVWIKFLITPLLCLLIGWLLGITGLALWVILILSVAPTAINAVIISRLFRLNQQISAGAFMLTTVIYLVVVLPVVLLQFR